MHDDEARYVAENYRVAEELLHMLGNRRLLYERREEDYEECRLSADSLRGTLGNLMLAVQNKGVLLDALQDMQRACRNFVTAAGRNSQAFYSNPTSFDENLTALRLVFGQRLRLIVNMFDLTPSSEIQQVMDETR